MPRVPERAARIDTFLGDLCYVEIQARITATKRRVADVSLMEILRRFTEFSSEKLLGTFISGRGK